MSGVQGQAESESRMDFAGSRCCCLGAGDARVAEGALQATGAVPALLSEQQALSSQGHLVTRKYYSCQRRADLILSLKQQPNE